jgi:3-phenylpropionate/trans-cinnamate dioxygenase ferredoxin reductase subunit
MLGKDASYEELPYFYTDQYDLGMEYVGHVGDGYDQMVVRGDVEAREFVAFWLKEGRVQAGMNVNIWDVTDSIKSLIRSGHPVDVGALADAGTPLEELVPG